MNNRNITYKEAINEALEEEFANDPHRILIGEDIVGENREPVAGNLKKKFPDRVINSLPLVEEMLCGIGLGMHLGGLKPVIQFDYSTFLTLSFYELFKLGTWRYRMAEKDGPGIVIIMGHDNFFCAGPEFATSLLASVFHLPNIWIAAPIFPYHTKGLLKTALRANRPVLFVEEKYRAVYKLTGQVPAGDYSIPFGQAVIAKPGNTLTIISWLSSTIFSIEAAHKLEKEGISVEVVSLQTLQPMDTKTIFASAKKTRRVVIVENEMLRGGIGAEICAQIHESVPGCKIIRVANLNVPLPPASTHIESIMITTEKIEDACRNLSKNG